MSIEYDSSRKNFLLQCKKFSYALGVNRNGYLCNLHWGGRIEHIGDLPDAEELTCYRHGKETVKELTRQEYPAWCGDFFNEPALKVDFPDGVRISTLKYQQHEIKDNELTVSLTDIDYPLNVKLHYLIREDVGILERWSEISNHGNNTVCIQNAMSANLSLTRIDCDYRLSHLSGRWGKENTIERQMVQQDKIVLESRTGLSGHFATPFFALDKGCADENNGEVWFGALRWSGNWKISIERNAYEQVNVCGGINDFDFSWPLQAGETFSTPQFCIGYSESGFGEMSRAMHHYQLKHLLPQQPLRKPMPVIFNSWSSMLVDVSEEKILAVAKKASEIGVELFVIDDGWQSALGDWFPDKNKFPHGLRPVVEKVKSLGMDFGLWVEIESFEMKSELFKKHPDWMMAFPTRKEPRQYRHAIGRTSMLLNFAREEVAQYMYEALHKLIKETGIKYLKLDMNYYFSAPGWNDAPEAERQTIWVKYVYNIYKVFARLGKDFPEVIIENCASGGARSDLGMSPYFSRINRSDNQDTLDILRLHEGFTWLHPSRLAGGALHISETIYNINLRHIPMRFQAFAGMMGSLAVGKNLLACSSADMNEISDYIKLHKRFRHIPQFGELYRLASHYECPYAAYEYVSLDRQEALLFVFGHSIQFGYKVPAMQLKGLEPDTTYRIECFGDNLQSSSGTSTKKYRPVTGQGLMQLGVRVELLGDYDAWIIHLQSIDLK